MITLKPLVALIVAACASVLPLPPVDSPNFEQAVSAAARDENEKASFEHPRIGCIVPTLIAISHTDGKILPEVVRVVGVYPFEDSLGQRQVMVLRAGQFNKTKWVPMPEASIRFVNCGSEANSFREPANRAQQPSEH